MTTKTIEPRMELEQNLHLYRQMAKIRACEEPDACDTRENMDREALPSVFWNPSVMRDAAAALRKLRDQAHATMFYGHDPGQGDATPRAPAPVV